MCTVRSFHEFHDNVVIRATYAHILPNEKYRKYRVINVSKPKILCNRVDPKKRYRRGVFVTMQDFINEMINILYLWSS